MTNQVDKISLRDAREIPVWMMVWASEPKREIDVRMTYDDLRFIVSVYATKERMKQITGGRCKECKHYDGDYWCRNDDIPVEGDDATRFTPDPDFFCALFERRYNDDTPFEN